MAPLTFNKALRAFIALIPLFAVMLGLTAAAIAAPLFGQSPRTQFFLGTAIRSFGLFQNSSGGGKDLEVWTAPFIGSYAFRPDVTGTLVVPYVNKRFETPTQLVRAINSRTFYRARLPSASLRKVVLKIEGMKDPDAATRVASVLNKLDGIEGGSLDIKKQEAQLKFDSKKLTVEKILAAVRSGTPFKTSVQSSSSGGPTLESAGTPLREETGWFGKLWRKLASVF